MRARPYLCLQKQAAQSAPKIGASREGPLCQTPRFHGLFAHPNPRL